MNRQDYRWEIQAKGKTEDIIATLLKIRGIKTISAKKEFLYPTDPHKLTLRKLGLKEAEIKKTVQRIKLAIKNRQEALVYGDYDADGICATAILWETLYKAGLKVLPYIPERFTEGYGLNIESLKKLAKANPNLKLIFTVDHGIVANSKVDVAKDLGIDVVISDHHEIGKVLPKAYSIVHTTKICGSAVAWILARETRKAFKIKDTELKLGNGLDLAAIGTIADQMPLIGANRSFAKYGLSRLNETLRPGLIALFQEAVIRSGTIGSYAVGFLIAPRINATGRLTHAIDSLRLLCTKDRERAEELAIHIGKVNGNRQKIVEEVVAHAREQMKKDSGEGIIVLADESYHEGVIGLAAARIVEEFYRPVIVISKKGDISKASARSISGLNIIQTIRKLGKLYLEGGGHPMAAGFSIETKKIALFTKKINQVAKKLLTKEILTRRLKIDLEIDFNNLNWDLTSELKKFEPSGLGNPTPTFLTKKVNIISAKTVGKDNSHLKLTINQDKTTISAIGFGFGKLFGAISPDKKYDLVYNLEEDSYNGNESFQLRLKDIREG